MLYIKTIDKDMVKKDIPNLVWRISRYFDNTYEDEWIRDGLVREIIKDVEGSEVSPSGTISDPIRGDKPPALLSNDAKALILMLKLPDKVIYTSNCGDNCNKWILEISKHIDITICREEDN